MELTKEQITRFRKVATDFLETIDYMAGLQEGKDLLQQITENEEGVTIKKEEKKDYTKDIEEIRKMYPGTKCKKDADNKLPKLIKEYGKEQLIRSIKRYIHFVDVEKMNGFPSLKYKNESTYWNKGYMDYLDENYKDNNIVQNQPQVGWGRMKQF